MKRQSESQEPIELSSDSSSEEQEPDLPTWMIKKLQKYAKHGDIKFLNWEKDSKRLPLIYKMSEKEFFDTIREDGIEMTCSDHRRYRKLYKKLYKKKAKLGIF
jgi:hypothetical protein